MENSLINWSESASARLKLVPREFYAGDTLQVARDLLGKILVVRSRPSRRGAGASESVGRIVETEGYHGEDPASHSARGETPRCKIMFGEPGFAYVYLIYGIHKMLNFVTERAGYPGAVLIRALEPLAGIKQSKCTNGPGRLTEALGITMKDNGESLQGPRISVLDDGFRAIKIHSSPRVGISKAVDSHWRYFLADHPHVSRARENSLARACSGGSR